MSYRVLARKWRPKNFSEIVGQDHVVRPLSNALNQNKLHHAYLFCGTRGVGKTTIARILAKSLNCEAGISATPCGQCNACNGIAQGNYIDLIEVDAASRTGVDDTRALMEQVQYPPSVGRYKIYLIDEVHMFSKSSFNALLKTLEEPPEHVKFLFATTDPQKLLPTVLSRCLQFTLKRVPLVPLTAHLSHIVQAESRDAEGAVLRRIAQLAEGSVRDALSLLDQALSYDDGTLQLKHIETMLGYVPHETLYGLIDSVIDRNAETMVQQLAKLHEYTPDYTQVLLDLLALLHQVATAKAVPGIERESIFNSERIQQFARQMPAEDIQLFYQIALCSRRDLPYTHDERDALEMTFLRMIAFTPPEPDDVDSAPPTARKPTSNPPLQRPVAAEPTQKSTNATSEPPNSTHATKGRTDTTPLKPIDQWQAQDWDHIVQRLAIDGMYGSYAAHCALRATGAQHIELTMQENTPCDMAVLRDKLTQALTSLYQQPIEVRLETARSSEQTPHARNRTRAQEASEQFQQTMLKDPMVQGLQQQFDATIDKKSIALHDEES